MRCLLDNPRHVDRECCVGTSFIRVKQRACAGTMNAVIHESTHVEQSLGTFLKHRRSKLDPAALGFSHRRRRTPGLRREEVAVRANISTTWYTWLEQGRGGAPSRGVLERIGKALLLTEAEREHMFLLAFGHVPEVHCQVTDVVPDYLQRTLDAMTDVP